MIGFKYNLIDVGMPHLGEESEGRRGVWVVNGEFDACLEEITHLLGNGCNSIVFQQYVMNSLNGAI